MGVIRWASGCNSAAHSYSHICFMVWSCIRGRISHAGPVTKGTLENLSLPGGVLEAWHFGCLDGLNRSVPHRSCHMSSGQMLPGSACAGGRVSGHYLPHLFGLFLFDPVLEHPGGGCEIMD